MPYFLEGIAFPRQQFPWHCVCQPFLDRRKCSSQSVLAVDELTCRKGGCDERPFLVSLKHHLGFKTLVIHCWNFIFRSLVAPGLPCFTCFNDVWNFWTLWYMWFLFPNKRITMIFPEAACRGAILHLGGWFERFFIFSPTLGENEPNPFWRASAYFSTVLVQKPGRHENELDPTPVQILSHHSGKQPAILHFF